MRLDADVVALHRRAQEGARGRHAAAALGGDLVDADAFLGRAVEVLVERQPGLLAGRQEALGQRMDVRAIVGDMDRAAPGAPVGRAGLVVLDRLEDGQQRRS